MGSEIKTLGLKERECIIREISFALLLFFFGALTSFNGCDYGPHIQIAVSIDVDTIKNIVPFLREVTCYPLWHMLTRVNMLLFGMPATYAAAFVSGMNYAVMYVVACTYFKACFPKARHKHIVTLSAVLYLVAGIYIPWYNQQIYIGQASPNTWHNPTNIMVNVVGLIVFILIVRVAERIKETGYRGNVGFKDGIAIASALVVANFAKPSFAQILYPALVLWMIWHLVKSKGKALKMGVQLALACVPSLIVMIFQFISAFYGTGDDGGVRIAFLEYWKLSSPNVLVSILLVIAFPLLMLAIAIKRRQIDEETLLSWSMLLCGAVEKALLIEGGERATHGNFGWGYALGLFFVWFSAIKKYIQFYICDGDTSKRASNFYFVATTVILLLHLAAGLLYLYRLIILKHIY